METASDASQGSIPCIHHENLPMKGGEGGVYPSPSLPVLCRPCLPALPGRAAPVQADRRRGIEIPKWLKKSTRGLATDCGLDKMVDPSDVFFA